ncbi:hypothetical protein [Metabacillus malikii]|uniref:DUF4309 domain-containing protein n=1 Tax=Metabacillus malikii TaxID=1504265 RepID=A0ABT9ZLL8_9BACI|nr:hypothetical protein [Metabacillus malikii]MDQ0233159.1 hypothetical protein [Metabacillus malikii]
MKKTFTIIVTALLTTVVTLFVLWKLDVIYLNLSTPVEKGKEFIGQDELSLLLKQEYPHLGDEIQVAHTLLGEPVFTSDGQKDFDLLNGEETVYITFEDRQHSDKIQSFQLYVSGDKEKIVELGKKFLPTGSSYIKEKEDEIERKNETIRYTKTEFLNRHYYQMPNGDGFAYIQVSNNETDLFDETRQQKEINYDLEVSYVSEMELRHDLGMIDEYTVVNGEIVASSLRSDELVIDETNEASDAKSEDSVVESAEENILANDVSSHEMQSFSDHIIDQNNEKVKDSTFRQLAKTGKIEGINVQLYVPNGPEIDAHIGQPDWRVPNEGGYFLMYEQCGCGYGVEYDYEELPDSPINSYYLPIRLTRDEIVQSLGEPTSEGDSEIDGKPYLYYQLGNYELFIDKSLTSQYYNSISLK